MSDESNKCLSLISGVPALPVFNFRKFVGTQIIYDAVPGQSICILSYDKDGP